jgi:hypothetical protein
MSCSADIHTTKKDILNNNFTIKYNSKLIKKTNTCFFGLAIILLQRTLTRLTRKRIEKEYSGNY